MFSSKFFRWYDKPLFVYKFSDYFFKFISLKKGKLMEDDSKLSDNCDCLTCERYTKSYLAHLFKTGDSSAGRLITIHNLRFYSMLMEKIRNKS